MTAPDYLPADTYTGKTRVLGKAKSSLFTAAGLAALIGAGNTTPLFVYYGHLHNGQKLFSRDRFYSDGEQIYGYDATGGLMIIHPADRKIRVLTH